MTRENVKKNMDIISAFAEDKVIQIINEKGEWVDLTERDGLPIETIAEDPSSFRIKPESKYRPFKDAEECWAEMLKHLPFGWVKDMDGSKFIIEIVNLDGSLYVSDDGTCYFSEMLKNYTFADGTPFGVKIED